MKQKFDHFLNIELIILLSYGDESHDKGSLHFCLIKQLFFTSSLSKFIEDEGTGYGCEDEHIEEDVEDEHAVVPSILLNGWQLVVGVGVICS